MVADCDSVARSGVDCSSSQSGATHTGSIGQRKQNLGDGAQASRGLTPRAIAGWGLQGSCPFGVKRRPSW